MSCFRKLLFSIRTESVSYRCHFNFMFSPFLALFQTFCCSFSDGAAQKAGVVQGDRIIKVSLGCGAWLHVIIEINVVVRDLHACLCTWTFIAHCVSCGMPLGGQS